MLNEEKLHQTPAPLKAAAQITTTTLELQTKAKN